MSAIDAIRALSEKKPQPGAAVVLVEDVAILAAKKSGSGVMLGLDSDVTEEAARCAQVHDELERAEQEYAVLQARMRKYGAEKREAYNDAYKANITTVKVPYEVQTPIGPERRAVLVTCTNKYSVQSDVVFANREVLGASYDALFEETRTKSLKPNAETLIRGVFQELGLSEEQVENSMQSLFQETVKVTAKKEYETEVKKAPQPVQDLLSKMVTRQQPSVKFGA